MNKPAEKQGELEPVKSQKIAPDMKLSYKTRQAGGPVAGREKNFGPHIMARFADSDEPDAPTLGPAKETSPELITGTASGLAGAWENFAANVRDATPAVIINNGSRINFSMRGAADALSLWSGAKYASPDRLAASAISLGGLALGAMYKETEMDPAEKERRSHLTVPEYLALRVRDAFNPALHPTATVGLATIPNGLLTMRSGFKQSRPGSLSKEVIQGAMTVAAGAALNFIPNPERAWQVSTGIFLARAPVAWQQASSAYHNGKPKVPNPRAFDTNPEDWFAKPGDWQQWGKWWLNQGSNAFGFLYGGVKKEEDGTVIRIHRKIEPGKRAIEGPIEETLPLALHPADAVKEEVQPERRIAGPLATERVASTTHLQSQL